LRSRRAKAATTAHRRGEPGDAIAPARGRADLGALLDILADAFNFPRANAEQYARAVGRRNYRVIRAEQGREIAGGCALIPMGQHFGGRSIGMTGIGAVGVAPRFRGTGVAKALMRGVVREMHDAGVPLSTLYPATLPLYRFAGYETAGSRFEIRIPTKSIHMREESLTMRLATPRDDAAIRRLYLAYASRHPGTLDRNEFLWKRVHLFKGTPTIGHLVVNPATKQPEGYVFLLRKESTEAPYSLWLTDYAAVTPAAGRRLLAFLSAHRSMTDYAQFHGSPNEPILRLLPERGFSCRLVDPWMLRIVRVKDALEARGYPPDLRTECAFQVIDDLLPENSGAFTMRIDKGRANVRRSKPEMRPIERPGLRLDIRGLASLYSGQASPHDLLETGQLTLANRLHAYDDSLDRLAAIFAGPMPWMRDMF
jgi:predicted acetyltransferase